MDQMYRVESPIQKYGQVPRNKLVNPPLSELHSLVEEGWLALYSGYIPPDEERLPLASLLDIRVELSPLECIGDTLCPFSGAHEDRASGCLC